MALYLNDLTTNGNNLTNSGAAESTTLPFATNNVDSADFELGSSNFMYAGDSASLSITGDLTLECWVNIESKPADNLTLMGKWNDNVNQRSYLLRFDAAGNNLLFDVSSDGTDANRTQATVAWNPNLATWYHVAVVYTAAGGTADFYVNGSQQGTQQSGLKTSIFDGTCNFVIGAKNAGHGGEAQFMDGLMDDLRVYNVARTGVAINGDKSIEQQPPVTNLVAYWAFETYPVTASGSSGYAFVL